MRLLTALSVFLYSGILASAPFSFHEVTVFGDSLSDNGNLYELGQHQFPQSPPYFEGRFSNGPVWIEQLVASYFPKDSSSHLSNYAFGGARVLEASEGGVITLEKEIDSYLSTHENKANPDTLYIVWIGANDYLNMPRDIDLALEAVNLGIDHSLNRLAERGAKHILVLNLPDLGRSPIAFEYNVSELLSYLTREHNKLLEKTLRHLQRKYPQAHWLLFDSNQAFDQVLESPEQYGLNNTTLSCIASILDESGEGLLSKTVSNSLLNIPRDACNGYLFFDSVHPTEIGHKILSEKIQMMLNESGVKFS